MAIEQETICLAMPSEVTPAPLGRRPWHLALHMYVAFFTLCYFVKGLYFIFHPAPFFSLTQHPRTDQIWMYGLAALFVAAVSLFIILRTYKVAFALLSRRLAGRSPAPALRTDRLLVLCCTVAALAFLIPRAGDVVQALQTGSFLIRRSAASWEEFSSGMLGMKALFMQIQAGLLIILSVYAVQRRDWGLIMISLLYFLASAITSNGSRFQLLSSILLLPTLYYLLVKRRPSHRNLFVAGIYGAVLLLPFLAAFLLVARRSTGSLFATEQVFIAALVSFDPADHLVNYLYVLPVDWLGTRTIEEIWQVVPRALFPDKPFLYGMLALQNVLYPGSIGNHTGTFLYGHYPMSSLAVAVDFGFLPGLVLHALMTGWFLAFLDAGFETNSLLLVALFAMNIFFLYHLIRVGIVNHVIMGLQSMFIPLLIASALRWAGKFSLTWRPVRRPT
ncbi:MAG: hypothetical protein FJ246_07440 [Nitrospira sp.]|nr:hypothetical protein [Nitrospira sp.]